MSGTIYRRPSAKEDLIEIWSYIANDNQEAATRLLQKIDGVLAMLGKHPEAGRERPELVAGLRSFPIGNYIVFYHPLPDGIDVVRVLSGYLDLDQIDLH